MSGYSPENLQAVVNSLHLIPYFKSHPQRSVMEAAQDLGMSIPEITTALDRLHASGVGPYTEDMVDLEWNYGNVNIINDQGLSNPMRLTRAEASALLVQLEMAENLPGVFEHSAVLSAAAKLRELMGNQVQGIYDTTAEVDSQATLKQELINQAINQRRQLEFLYHSASEVEPQLRRVDPVVILVRDGKLYLEAVIPDSGAKGHRTFRVDRMEALQILKTPAGRHPSETTGSFEFAHHVDIHIRESASWLSRYEAITLGKPIGGGWLEATIGYGSVQWLKNFIASQGDRMRLVRPESLARELTQRAQLILERYDGSSDTVGTV